MGDVIHIPGLNPSDTWNVMCHGLVKLRDERGEYIRDELGNVATRPCRNWAVRFTMVCPAHGSGRSPEAAPRRKAEERRNELRDKLAELGTNAVEAVREVLTYADKDTDKLKAAEMVLSRFVPTKTESESTIAVRDHVDLDEEIAEALGEEQQHGEEEAG